MVEKKKPVFMVTHGPENPELATIPFVMATRALASEIDVVMGFVGNGAFCAVCGMAERVSAPGVPPLKELMDFYAEADGCTCTNRASDRVTSRRMSCSRTPRSSAPQRF